MYTHILSYITPLNSLADTEQQHHIYTSEMDASLFTSDTSTHCEFNIVPDSVVMEIQKPREEMPIKISASIFHSTHKYRDTFGDGHIQYHDSDTGDAFTYKDKYTALLQQK